MATQGATPCKMPTLPSEGLGQGKAHAAERQGAKGWGEGMKASPRQNATPRIPTARGWQEKKPSLKGPNGRNFCTCGCGLEVPKGRQTFFSNEHVDNWKQANPYPNELRHAVWKRDQGKCALCGTVCQAGAYDLGQWHCDHIVALVEGGANSLANARTLCIPCHKLETAQLRKRLAEAKAMTALRRAI